MRLAWIAGGKAPASVEQDAGVKSCEVGRGDSKGRKAADVVDVHGPTVTNGSGQSSFGQSVRLGSIGGKGCVR